MFPSTLREIRTAGEQLQVMAFVFASVCSALSWERTALITPEIAEGCRNVHTIHVLQPRQISEAVSQFFRQLPGCTLINDYGPSETHVVTSYRMPRSRDLWQPLPPIGVAISNTQLFIVDSHANRLPIGMHNACVLSGRGGCSHSFLAKLNSCFQYCQAWRESL